jgi:signal peptidase I
MHAGGDTGSDMGDYVVEETAPRQGGEPRREPARRASVMGILREMTIVIGLSLIIATLVRIFLVQAFLIPSTSMQDTLQIGDRVLVSKLTTRFGEIQRGDVVVFSDPNGWLNSIPEDNGGIGGAIRSALTFVGVLPEDGEGHLIKRVVGLPGDTVMCCEDGDDGRLVVNDVPIDEAAYLRPGSEPSSTTFDVTLGEDEYFVLGDNRANSGDSRVNGTVPADAIVGRAFAVAWPVSRWDGISDGDAFDVVPDD